MIYRMQGEIIVEEQSRTNPDRCRHTPEGDRRRRTTIQVPTFFLDSNIQGITNADQALAIAEKIVNPANLPSITVASMDCRGYDSDMKLKET